MTPEQLMQRRWKVIANYPGSNFHIGYIIKEEENLFGEIFYKEEIPKYPHLFQELLWYEERQESEMPKYVKEVDSLYKIGEVIKVAEWELESEETDIPCFRDEKENCFTWVRGFLPSTEQEYLDYQNKVKNG